MVNNCLGGHLWPDLGGHRGQLEGARIQKCLSTIQKRRAISDS